MLLQESLCPSAVTCVMLYTTACAPPVRPEVTTTEPRTALRVAAVAAESKKTLSVSKVPACATRSRVTVVGEAPEPRM